MAKVYNMGSNDFVLPTYKKKSKEEISGANIIESAIVIEGGAGVAFSDNERIRRRRDYVETTVTAEELKALETNKAFMRKVDRGFITIGKPPERFKTDKSAQKNAADTKQKITTGSIEE